MYHGFMCFLALLKKTEKLSPAIQKLICQIAARFQYTTGEPDPYIQQWGTEMCDKQKRS